MRILADHPDGLSFKTIKEKSLVPHTTLIRILKTLEVQHFVALDASGGYRLGSELHRIAGVSLRNLDVREEALPFLKELAETTRATSFLATLAGDKSLIVAVENSPEKIQVTSEPGTLVDLHSSATGKCLLAHAIEDPVEFIEKLPLEAKTSNTITEVDSVIENLEVIREKGYSIDDEEHTEGVRSCSAPVFDSMGEAVAAIGIAAPGNTFPSKKDERIGKEVKRMAQTLSRRLGHAQA